MLQKLSPRPLAVAAAAAAIAAALMTAPMAAADEYGGGGPDNPLMPGCQMDGGGGATGGMSTECASPGSSELDATPNDLGVMGAMIDEPMVGFGWR